MAGSDHDSVIPAQVSYLAIYNPTLGPTDETISDQIVYYTSRSSHNREISGSTLENEEAKDSENERLRQIGLAQGLVSFARYAVLQIRWHIDLIGCDLFSNFSEGKSLEHVETDKSRVILLELEKNWWIVTVSG